MFQKRMQAVNVAERDETDNQEGYLIDGPPRKSIKVVSFKTDVYGNTPDSGGASSSHEAPPNVRVASRCGIDSADAESMYEPSEAPAESDDEFGNHHEHLLQGPDPPGHEEAQATKRRRLKNKTAPVSVPAFPQRALLRQADFKIRSAKLKKAQIEQRKGQRATRRAAVDLLARQAEKIEDDSDEEVAAVPFQTPHASHHIAALHGSERVIWCRSCAAWSLSERLRGLARPCRGLKEGSRHTLRLLQCGVRPGPNARIPPQHIKMRRRKGRW